MAKYLINPIYSHKEIKENFILYVKTAFGTRYDSIEKEREELLNTDSIASREPWIEPLPSYNNIERNEMKNETYIMECKWNKSMYNKRI